MKRQDSAVKKKWLLFAGIGVCLCLIIAVALIIFMFAQKEQQQPDATYTELYWNVERMEYVGKGLSGSSGRIPGRDGMYNVRFAVQGTQRVLPVADKALVDRIDMKDLMGLVFDENGVVTDVLDVEECTGGYAANRYYVEKIDGDVVTCNTAESFGGMSVQLELTEKTQVYDVGGTGLLTGIPGTVAINDQIIAVKDYEGRISHIYLIPYIAPGSVYWNINQMYDSKSGLSTREPDPMGYYVFEFAVDGQIVTLKTRSMDIANSIDANAAKCTGLVFDDEGLIIERVPAHQVTGGSGFASWFHVASFDGRTIVAKKIDDGADRGNVVTGDLALNCKVFDVSGQGEFVGEPTTVREGDQIHCLTDRRGNICCVFVVNRIVDGQIYWNVERKWSGSATSRSAVNGWYSFLLATGGQQVTLRTDSKEFANKMDGNAAQCFCLTVDGDVITGVYSAGSATGGGGFASWADIEALAEDGLITAKKNADGADTGRVYTGYPSADCQVYNVSSAYSDFVGEATTLQLGDRIHALKDLDGNVAVIFVVDRPVYVDIYWNIQRMYDTKTKSTTRKAAEDGYYYFDMAVDGEVVRLRTRSKKIASQVDAFGAQCMGLQLSGDIITRVYSAASVNSCRGGAQVSWCHITELGTGWAKAEKRLDGPDKGTRYNMTVSSRCKIYNVSGSYISHPGEVTDLRVGDVVHCLRNVEKKTVLIYVVDRRFSQQEAGVYWNLEQKYNGSSSTRTADADGWYWFDMATDGQQVRLKTKDSTIVHQIDSNYAMCRGILTEGDEIVRVFSPMQIQGTEGGAHGSWVNVTWVAPDGRSAKAVKLDSGVDTGTEYDITLAENCRIYNVSKDVENFRGEDTDLTVGDLIHCLVNSEKQATIIYVITAAAEPVAEQIHKTHCVCGGLAEGMGEHTCESVAQWYTFNEKTQIANGGNYCLTADVTLNQMISIKDGQTVVLCLNGHKLTIDNTANRMFSVENGTLTICDCSYDAAKDSFKGSVEAKRVNYWAAVANVAGSNAVLNIYGGNFKNASAKGTNMFYINSAGTMRLYNGHITGGSVDKNPEGVEVEAGGIWLPNGRLYMYGGTVTGGHGNNAGGISVQNASRLIITGGKVTGNTAKNPNRNDIFLSGVGTCTVSIGGSAVVGQLYVGGSKTLELAGAMTGDASVGVYMQNPGTLINGISTDISALFTCQNDGMKILHDPQMQRLYVGAVQPQMPDAHQHCQCGGATKNHSCDADTLWVPAQKSALTTTGNYYLTEDMTLSATVILNAGQNVKLCLNGHKLTIDNTSNRMFSVENGTLTICDCSYDAAKDSFKGSVEAKRVNYWAAVANVAGSNAALNIYGGNFKNASAKGTNMFYINSAGTMRLYNGHITGGSVDKNPEGVEVEAGGIWLPNGTLYMYGGTVTGGYGNNAGGISVQNASRLIITGGKVTGNTAKYPNRNDIFLSGVGTCTVSIGGSAVVGQLYVGGSKTLELSGAMTGDASIGVYMQNPGTLMANITQDISDRFSSFNTGFKVYFREDKLVMEKEAV